MREDIAVRIGVLDDLDEVMRLAEMMHQEIGVTAFKPEKLLPQVYAALAQDGGIMGVIGPVGGPLEGAVLLLMGPLFYGDEIVLEEKGLFVRPDLRAAKGGRAARLGEFAKQASDTLEIPLLIGVFNDVRTQGKLRLYERMFGPQVGAFFLHRPRQASTEAA